MNIRKKICLLAAALALALGLSACGESILPPKESATPAPAATPTPTPTPAPFSGEIETLEVNQALSYGIDARTGELYEMENFVAGRDTAVFVRLSEALGHNPDERDYLEIWRKTQLLGTYAPGDLSTETGLCFTLTGEDAAALTAGDYVFRAVVDGQELTREVTLTDTAGLRVLLVPILGNYGGTSAYPSEGWQEYLWHLQACWPLANDGLETVIAPGLNLTGEDYDLTRTRGMWAAWEALREQAGLLGDYDLVIGVVNGMMGEGNSCGSFGRDGVVLINGQQDAPEAAITHFAAQMLGAGDEYEGGLLNPSANPAPAGVTGTDAVTGEAVTSDAAGVETASDYGLFCEGSVVKAAQIPFDLSRARLLSDAASFMGGTGEYTQSYWVTSDLWNYLFDELTAETPEPEAMPLPEGSSSLICISGLAGRDGSLTLAEPVSAAAGTAWNQSAETGAYRIVFVDGSGAALSRFWFDLDYTVFTDSPQQQDWAPFDFVLPAPDGAVGVLIYGPAADAESGEAADTLLGRFTLWTLDPASFFTNLEEGQSCSGITRVEWTTETGEDTPADVTPYYELYFQTEDISLLVYRGKTASAEVDMLSMPEATDFRFLLLTCAGGRSATAVSPSLTMAD